VTSLSVPNGVQTVDRTCGWTVGVDRGVHDRWATDHSCGQLLDEVAQPVDILHPCKYQM
jgi:hypothetical protein